MSERFKITEEEISQTLMHSPFALPDSPSRMGLGAGQIKKYFYDFIRLLSDRINVHLSDVGTDVEAVEKKTSEAEETARAALDLASGKSRVHIVGNVRLLFENLLSGEMKVGRGDFIFVTEKGVPDFIVYSAEGALYSGNPHVVTNENAGTIKPQVGEAYMTAQNHVILIGIETGLDTSVFATQGMLSDIVISLRADLASKEELERAKEELSAENTYSSDSTRAQSGQAIDKFLFVSGKNLYNPENNTVGKRADESGQETNLTRSEWIPVAPLTDYVLSNQTGTAYNFNVAEKSSDGTVKPLFVSIRLQNVPNNYNALPYQKITTSSDAAFIRFSAYGPSANPAMEKEMMLERGSEMTEYEPYEKYIKPALINNHKAISEIDEIKADISKADAKAQNAENRASSLEKLFVRIKNLYNPENDTFGARADGSGNPSSTNARNSEWIAVKPNTKYVLSLHRTDSNGGITIVYALKDGDGNITTYPGTGSITVPYYDTTIHINKRPYYTVETGADTTHFKFSTYASGNNDIMRDYCMLTEYTPLTDFMGLRYEPYSNKLLDYNRLPEEMKNPWMGKRLVIDGDSISHDWGIGKYWQFVASELLGMWMDTSIVSGYDDPENGTFGCGWAGIGGSTIAHETQAMINAGVQTTEDPRQKSILLRHQNLPDDADAVLIAGGSNDWAHSAIDIGETDSDDITTFNGALNALLPSLKAKYPSVPIVMMTPIKRGTRHGSTNKKGYTLEQFANALIAKCKEYGVYCLDMWSTCPVNPQIPIMQEMYFNKLYDEDDNFIGYDDTHPNFLGQAIMGKTVAGFLKTIYP